jgi:hypothetical protein
MKYSYLTNKVFICSTLTTFAGLAWTPSNGAPRSPRRISTVHHALLVGSRQCTTLSSPDLDGAPRSPRRILTVHHALPVGSRRCTTLSSLDLDGAPRSPRRILTMHHAEKEKRRRSDRRRRRNFNLIL